MFAKRKLYRLLAVVVVTAVVGTLAGLGASGWRWGSCTVDGDMDGYGTDPVAHGHARDSQKTDAPGGTTTPPGTTSWGGGTELFPPLPPQKKGLRHPGGGRRRDAPSPENPGLWSGGAAGDVELGE